jgi:hypothetical protein
MAFANDWRFRQRTIVPLLTSSLLLLSSCAPLSLVDAQLQFSQDGSEENNRARVCYTPTVDALARDADFLERHIETYGSVVTKQPDVWGQSRLTIYRNEYEQLMKAELDNFQFTLQGTVSGSDQAYFADSFALGAAATAGAARPGTASRGAAATAATSNTTVVPTSSTESADKSQSQTPSGGGGDSSSPQLAVPTPPSATGTFDAFNNVSRTKVNMPTPIGFLNPKGGLTIEPTLFLDQKSVYLNHLHELRRISEGDDTADSPGYALNLVRFPVSILPGRRTYKGYGAEITMTMRPHLNEELLPTTFRNLVINDVVEQVSFPATQFINDPSKAAYLGTSEEINHLFNYFEKYSYQEMQEPRQVDELRQLRWEPALQEIFKRPEWQWVDKFLDLMANRQVANYNRNVNNRNVNNRKVANLEQEIRYVRYQFRGAGLVPATKSRRARLPFSPTELLDVYGYDFAFALVAGPYQAFSTQPYSHPAADATNVTVIHLPDVQAYFQEETNGAYRFLQEKGSDFLWEYCSPQRGLANAIRTHNANRIGAIRTDFKRVLEAVQSQGATTRDPLFHHSLVAALAWGIVVESALLNEQLLQDMRESTALKGCPPILIPDDKKDFYKPDPSPEAREAFNQYVDCRWPTHAFALDPAAWEQNIGSTFSMRREMQLALSLAFVSGKISANNMMQFARRIEFDFATVDINGTAVGFSHGDETFGWRFYPRFQVPDVDNNLTVFFRDQLWGGPNKNVFLKQRRLEPGIRECYAVIIMPSFVPYATLNVSANWFNLVNPQRKELNTQYAVKLSNRVKQIQTCVPCIVDGQNYRDDEVERLKEKVNQLATRLPLQSTKVQIPYENTLGGFGMFNTGVTDLAPELVGWYGTSSINPNAPTTLFLAGDHFSVHQTTVVAGGQPIAAEQMHLLSRQVAQITIPPSPLLVGDATQKYVDVQLATPYGVTQHLLIPANVPPSPGVAWATPTVQVSPSGNVTVSGSDDKSQSPSGTPKSSDSNTPADTNTPTNTPDTTTPTKSTNGAKTPAPTDNSTDPSTTSKSTGGGKTSDTSSSTGNTTGSNSTSSSKSTATSKSTGSSTATSSAPASSSSTPATLLIKAGEINSSLYNVIDVTLQFDAKYKIQPITISGVTYDAAQGGYPVPVSSFAPQVASALRQYVASTGTTVPPSVAATTQLAFHSTTHLLPPLARTTANIFKIQWTK